MSEIKGQGHDRPNMVGKGGGICIDGFPPSYI